MSLKLAGALFWLALILGFLEWRFSISSQLRIDLTGSQRFATDFFGPHVPFHSVLSASLSAPTKNPDLFCTVAIVRLTEFATDAPPDIPLIDRKPGSFGGNWKRGPESSAIAGEFDALAVCSDAIPGRLVQELQIALQRPEGFYIRDWRAKTLQVYSYPDQIAAYVHFGPRPSRP
jgi:hypothetical protein